MTNKTRRKDTPKMEDWITTSEAASLLGVSRAYIVMLIGQGIFEARKVNHEWHCAQEIRANDEQGVSPHVRLLVVGWRLF